MGDEGLAVALAEHTDWAYGLLRNIVGPWLTRWGCCASIQGSHRVPRQGPGVLVCNHPSFLDPYVISASIPREIHWVAAAFIQALPLVGRWSQHLGVLPLRRGPEGAAGRLVKDVEQALKAGQLLGIFPEGMDGMRGLGAFEPLASFHPTFVRGILQAQIPFLPIIPVGVIPLRSRWQGSLPARALQPLDPCEPAFQSGTLEILVYREALIRVGPPTTWDAHYAEFNRCVYEHDTAGSARLVQMLNSRMRTSVKALLTSGQTCRVAHVNSPAHRSPASQSARRY
jgi:1-acyl-sn-glycerol-3-phosphate acyltransferase